MNGTVRGGESNHSVDLLRATAIESKNDHFDVERSTDGKLYTTIATGAGSGNSASQKDCTATDPSPVNGLNYYRLRQVDLDGKSTYSTVVTVTTAGSCDWLSVCEGGCTNTNIQNKKVRKAGRFFGKIPAWFKSKVPVFYFIR